MASPEATQHTGALQQQHRKSQDASPVADELETTHDQQHYSQPPAMRLGGRRADGFSALLLPAASYRHHPSSRTHSRKKVKLDHRSDLGRPDTHYDDDCDGANPPARDFCRRAKWSPDGSSILAQSDSHQLSIFRLLEHASARADPATAAPEGPAVDRHGDSTRRARLSLSLEASFRSPSPVLDAIWYPIPAYNTVEDPSGGGGDASVKQVDPTYQLSWCYVHSCRDLPTRLVDSSNGSTRASYGVMNQAERFVGPHSLAFSPDHGRLYCGDWSQISVLSLSSPGLNTHSRLALIQSGSASSAAGDGQRGYVSALAVTPLSSGQLGVDDAGQDDGPSPGFHDLLACGTFAGTVGLYTVDPTRLPPPQPHNAPIRSNPRHFSAATACLAGWTESDGNGIHQLAFHPLSPHILFVSSRKSTAINVYDTRYLFGDPNRLSFPHLRSSPPKRKRRGHGSSHGGERSGALLATLPREATGSHQRFWFDIDWAGRMLATGDADGCISIWRIDRGRFVDEGKLESGEGARDEAADALTLQLEPALKWKAHNDAVGSVSFHPHQALLLSASGSRNWPPAALDSDASSPDSSPCRSRSSSNSSGCGGSGCDGIGTSEQAGSESTGEPKRSWFAKDSSMKVWNLA